MKLSVLMPVWNESATLEEILRRVAAVEVDHEIIIVDNVSTDGTREILQAMLDSSHAGAPASNHRVRIAFQEENRGKGASVRRALELARGDWVIVQDADLEYDPRDYLKLMQAAQKRNLDVVFGTRLRGSTRAGQPRTSFFYGRVGLSVFFRLLYGSPLSDVATCYKLLKRPFAQTLDLQSDGFDLDFEIAAKVARAARQSATRTRRIRVGEVPISYAPRTELEGKKIRAVHDGLRAARALLKFRWSS